MNTRSRSHDDFMAENFRKDPAYAMELLDEILQDGALDEAQIVLRQMSKAFGGVEAVAAQAQLNGKSLYRALSSGGNPRVSTLVAVLRVMGLRLAVQPLAGAFTPAPSSSAPAPACAAGG